MIHKPEAQAKVIPGIEEPFACASGLSACELDRQQDGHVVLPRRRRTASLERSRHKPHVLLPRITNPKSTLWDHGNPAESIDETNERGPNGLTAARARRCLTCGVVSGSFDEQVPPPLIAWCCRAALFPGGTAAMPTFVMPKGVEHSCCRVLGSIGSGTCFSFRLSLGSWQVFRESASDSTWRIPFAGDNLTSIEHRCQGTSRTPSTRMTLPCQI